MLGSVWVQHKNLPVIIVIIQYTGLMECNLDLNTFPAVAVNKIYRCQCINIYNDEQTDSKKKRKSCLRNNFALIKATVATGDVD